MFPKPVLSLVIPNYNFGRFLQELLAGLDGLAGRDRLQVIVADGGSKDDSLTIARQFLRPHDQLLRGPDDGQADAIGKGLAEATGDWFMFQNSDDLFDLSALEAFLENPPHHGSHAVIAYDQDILVETNARWERRAAFRHSTPIGWRQLSWSIYYTNQATIYNRAMAQKTGFDSGKCFAMDYDFVVRFFKQHRPRVFVAHRVLGIQRLHADTKTSNMQSVCEAESADIRSLEFRPLDRVIGFSEAVRYHFSKRVAAWCGK